MNYVRGNGYESASAVYATTFPSVKFKRKSTKEQVTKNHAQFFRASIWNTNIRLRQVMAA
jgi:hypothetical protein